MKKSIFTVCLLVLLSLGFALEFDSNAAGEGWMKSGKGWWYQYKDGSYAKNEYIDGYWLDSAGWYDSSWNGEWKCNAKGWWFESGSWYPSNQWLKIDKKWYHFEKGGYMQRNSWVGNYYVGSDGAMVTEQWIGDYYVGKDGLWDSSKTKEESSNESTSFEVKPTSITIVQSEITIIKGEKVQLNTTIEPANVTNKEVKWESNDTSVATVDSDGYVIGKKSGMTTIVAISSNGLIDLCNVWVADMDEYGGAIACMNCAIKSAKFPQSVVFCNFYKLNNVWVVEGYAKNSAGYNVPYYFRCNSSDKYNKSDYHKTYQFDDTYYNVTTVGNHSDWPDTRSEDNFSLINRNIAKKAYEKFYADEIRLSSN